MLEVGRHHIDHAVLWQVAAGEQSAGHGRQLAKLARVIGLDRIAGRDHVPMASGQLLFQADDAVGCYLGTQAKEAGWVEEFQHFGHVLFISAQRFRVGFLAVISLIRQAQAGLNDISNGVLGTRVLGYPEGHRGANTGALKLTQALCQFLWVGRAQAVQIRIQWSHAGRVDSLGIHKGGIELARAAGVLVHDLVHEFLRLIAQRVEGAIHAAIIGNDVAFQPGSID